MRPFLRVHVTDAALAALVFLSRLPFLGPGAGNDNDAWFLVNAARELAASGRYTTSRFPGDPVQEWLCAQVARAGGGPEAMNVVSALAGAVATWLFARMLRRLGVRDVAVTGLAFALAPAMSVASVSAMDYTLAIAFVLAACEARLAGKSAWAGAWLGLAIGTRLTSVALLPAILLLPSPVDGAARARPRLLLAAFTAIVGAACYVPAQLRYGWGFLRFVDPLGTGSSPLDFATGFLHLDRLPVPPALVIGQATVLLWGLAGSALLAVALGTAFAPSLAGKPRGHSAEPWPRAISVAALTAIAAELLLYLRLPHDEGYLLPAVPFVLLLSARYAPRAWHLAACIAIALSSFALGVDVEPPKKGIAPETRSAQAVPMPLGQHRLWLDPWRGPLAQDHDKRVAAKHAADRVIAAFPRPPRDTLLFAGVVCAELTARHPQERAQPWYTDYLSEPDLLAQVAAGRTVLLLPGALERVRTVAGYDPIAAGARPWPELR